MEVANRKVKFYFLLLKLSESALEFPIQKPELYYKVQYSSLKIGSHTKTIIRKIPLLPLKIRLRYA